jgi:hypothetical protein
MIFYAILNYNFDNNLLPTVYTFFFNLNFYEGANVLFKNKDVAQR